MFLLPVLVLYDWAYYSGYKPIISNSISFDAKIYAIKRKHIKQVDIMALGSSTTLNDLNSSIIKSNFKQSYYNFGAWGIEIRDLNHMIKSYVSNYNPKYVVLTSNFSDFVTKPNGTLPDNLFFSLNCAPIYYLKNYTNYNDIIIRKKALKFYQDNTNDFSALKFDNYGGVALNVNRQTVTADRLSDINHLLISFPNKNTVGDYTSLDSLAIFLKTKNVKFIYIQAPFAGDYIKTNEKRIAILSHFDRCKNIVERNNGIYLNFEKNSKLPDSLFADPLYLNTKGAILLTNDIAQKLKSIINN